MIVLQIVLQIVLVSLMCFAFYMKGRNDELDENIEEITKVQNDYLDLNNKIENVLMEILQEDKNDDA